MKTPAVSIGIPTYEAGISLIRTLNSIFNQSAFSQIREVIIVVDGNTLTPQVRNRLRHPKVRIVMRPERMGQSSCLNYIFSRVHNGLLLLTNDDVVLDKHATKNFIECYIAQRPDFFIANSIEVKGRISKFYRREATVIYPPVEIADRIKNSELRMRNKNKTYYLAGGRLARAKNIDLIIEAANKLKLPLKIFGRAFAGYG